MVRLQNPLLVVLCQLLAWQGVVNAEHPVEGVISLLQKLTVQAKEEGAQEQQTFQKFTHWCKVSTKTLNKAIKEEMNAISTYKDQIAGLKKSISTLTEDIAALEKNIEEQNTIAAKAKERRQNETDLYEKVIDNLEGTIVAVDDAVEVMEASDVKQSFIGLKHKVKRKHLIGAGMRARKQPDDWQPPPPDPGEGDEMKELQASLGSMDETTKFREKAWSMSAAKSQAALATATTDLKKAALKAEKGGDDQLPDAFKHINLNPGAKNPFKKGKVKVYTETQEGEIIETFKGMEDGFEHDKLDTHEREANAQNAYNLAKVARDGAIKAAKDNKKEKEDIKADKESELAEAQELLAAEEKEYAGDAATLDSTDAECKKTNEAWEQRSKVRAGEIEAMTVAIKILTKVTGVRNPDEHEIPKRALAVKGTHVSFKSKFAKKQLDHALENVLEDTANYHAGVSFLQVSSDAPKDKAVAMLRQVAKEHHSGSLAKLAEQINAFDGPFDKIKAMIQKMIFRLMSEQKDEDDHKNWCDLELQTSEDTNKDKEKKIKMMKIKLDEMDAELKTTIKKITENNAKVAQIQAYMTEETEIREENKAEIKLTIKDAVDALGAVNNAINVLKDFYKESGMIAKEPWEFIQVSNSGVKLPDSPATWDSSYTGVANPKEGGNGVLALLDGVASKFSTMEAEARLQDETDQKAYEKDMAAKKVETADTESATSMKEEKKTSLQGKIDAMSIQLKATTKENDAVVQYLKDLEPACSPGEGSYEDRKKARSDEIAALRKAQGILEDAFRAK